MKLSNFKFIEKIGNNAANWKFRATVDVTTGFFRKETVTREIYKKYAGNWYFVDVGEFTPGCQVENLVRSFEAKAGIPLELMK